MQLADIKIRDVTRGTIKTLDRTASSMHRIKEMDIQVKPVDVYSGSDRDSSDRYATDKIEQYADSSAVVGIRAGSELVRHIRANNGAFDNVIGEQFHQNGRYSPETGMDRAVNGEMFHQPMKEESIKSIRGRKQKGALADREVIRNAEEEMNADHIERFVYRRSGERLHHFEKNHALNRRFTQKNGEKIHRLQKKYAMNRILTRQSRKRHALFLSFRPGMAISSLSRGNKAVRIMRTIGNSLMTKLLATGIGGTAALSMIIITIFFGAAFSFTGDETGDGFTIDLYGIGSGDTAIVEVAQAELGNVGGDKYWKWYGFSSHVHWCACFVSWCADQCGYIKEGVMPKYSLVGDGANWFRSRHRWAGGGYSPKPGDIIFFDYQHDGELDHTGIVESCDGKTVTTIEGNSRNACRRLTYTVGASSIAGYGVPEFATNGSRDKACAWAAMIAKDDSYHYVYFEGRDSTTHECPVCHDHSPGKYKGWNCIGFSFACWRHGAGIRSKCSCEVIDNGSWERLLNCQTDAEADRLASRMVGVPCMVIRNGGNAIPLSMLKKGDILSLFNGSTYFHTMFYEGKGKYADSTCGRSDEIQSGQTMSEGTKAQVKVAVRYVG